jgi:hypothetical protein
VKAVNLVTPEHEHEFEADAGLPEALPAGEHLLWQGSPDAWALARQAMHIDKLALYFGALLAWRLVTGLHDRQSGAQIGQALAGMLPLAVAALALLGGMAWLIARTTVYSLTNRRVVMRIGVVLSITFNLPFAQITAANLRLRGRSGVGDITLQLGGEGRIAYLHLWPHVRPWRLRQTEPMLRALPDAASVAQRLAGALKQAEQSLAKQPDALVRPVRVPPEASPVRPGQAVANVAPVAPVAHAA